MTETVTREAADFSQAGLCAGPALQRGPLAPDGEGFIQRIQPEDLLAGGLAALLVGLEEEAA